MLPRKQCIVCGRANRKSITDVTVCPVSIASGYIRNANVHADLRTKADCVRHTNAPYVIGISRDAAGFVVRFGTWDGESFVDRYFCTNSCARSQGYASADSGQRFTWKNAQ